MSLLRFNRKGKKSADGITPEGAKARKAVEKAIKKNKPVYTYIKPGDESSRPDVSGVFPIDPQAVKGNLEKGGLIRDGVVLSLTETGIKGGNKPYSESITDVESVYPNQDMPFRVYKSSKKAVKAVKKQKKQEEKAEKKQSKKDGPSISAKRLAKKEKRAIKLKGKADIIEAKKPNSTRADKIRSKAQKKSDKVAEKDKYREKTKKKATEKVVNKKLKIVRKKVNQYKKKNPKATATEIKTFGKGVADDLKLK